MISMFLKQTMIYFNFCGCSLISISLWSCKYLNAQTLLIVDLQINIDIKTNTCTNVCGNMCILEYHFSAFMHIYMHLRVCFTFLNITHLFFYIFFCLFLTRNLYIARMHSNFFTFVWTFPSVSVHLLKHLTVSSSDILSAVIWQVYVVIGTKNSASQPGSNSVRVCWVPFALIFLEKIWIQLFFPCPSYALYTLDTLAMGGCLSRRKILWIQIM